MYGLVVLAVRRAGGLVMVRLLLLCVANDDQQKKREAEYRLSVLTVAASGRTYIPIAIVWPYLHLLQYSSGRTYISSSVSSGRTHSVSSGRTYMSISYVRLSP